MALTTLTARVDQKDKADFDKFSEANMAYVKKRSGVTRGKGHRTRIDRGGR